MKPLITISAVACVLLWAAAPSIAQSSLCAIVPAPGSSNGGGSVGGAIFFDLTVYQAITISALDTNFSASVGLPVGMTVYRKSGTAFGYEGIASAWTQVAVDDKTALCAGTDNPTHITFASGMMLQPGLYGIALIAVNSGHRYTNGTGSNQVFFNADARIECGSAQNVPFSGPAFTPRVWNGCLYYGPACAAEYETGCAGSGGFVPELGMAGCAVAGGTAQIEVTNCLGGTTLFLFTGAGKACQPMAYGCALYLAILLPPTFAVPLGGSGPGKGSATIAGAVPSVVAGVTLNMQVFAIDPGVPAGFANSNGLEIHIQ